MGCAVVMLRLYTQHIAIRQVELLSGLSKTSETLLDSRHTVTCPCHLLYDICCMLHHVDSLRPLIACQSPPLLQHTVKSVTLVHDQDQKYILGQSSLKSTTDIQT